MTELTELGVAAIRDGVAEGDFTAREVAEAFNANVAAAQRRSTPSSSPRPKRRSTPPTRSTPTAPRASRSARWPACRSG